MSRASSPIFVFDRFVLEPHTASLLTDGEATAVEPKAFSVLCYLVEHRDRLVTKQELLDEVWANAIVTDNSLTRAVARLRKVLDDDSREPRFIATVHSRGYRFLMPVEVRSRDPRDVVPVPSARPDEGRTSSGASHLLRPRTAVLGILGILLVTAVLVSGAISPTADVPTIPSGDPTRIPPSLDARRVAVLPMTDLSGSPDSAFVVDGFTEQLITALSRIDGVRVVPRTTVMALRDQPRSVGEIGHDLGVGTVLEGSLTRDGDRYRVTVRVLEAVTEDNLWTKEVTCTLLEFFALQDEITGRVAEIVEAHVSQESLGRIARGPTERREAFELYLRGRAAMEEGNKEGNEKAVEFFELALAVDPDFALNLAGLARAYALRYVRFGQGTEWLDRARATAQRALDLQPDLSQAFESMALAEFGRSHIERALALSRKAVDLDPGNHRAARNAASYAYELGRWDESFLLILNSGPHSIRRPAMALRLWELGFDDAALELSDILLEEDPTRMDLGIFLTYRDYASGRYESARERIGGLMGIYENQPVLLMMAGEIELRAGEDGQALEFLERAIDLAKDWPQGLWDAEIRVAHLYHAQGRTAESEQILKRVAQATLGAIEEGSEWPTEPWRMAQIEVIRGNLEQAARWYRRAVDLGHRRGYADQDDPIFAPLRAHPLFTAEARRIENDVEVMKRAVRQVAGDTLERRPWTALY